MLLFWRTLEALPLAWRQRQKVLDQFAEIGNASLLMVCILSLAGSLRFKPAHCWSGVAWAVTWAGSSAGRLPKSWHP